MTDDEIRWIAQAAIFYNALIFVWRLQGGTQTILLPRFWYATDPTPLYQA